MRPLRIRALSMDVTGTLVSFRGTLEQHYLGSAEKCGVELPSTMLPIGPAFRQAYKEISQSTSFVHTSQTALPCNACATVQHTYDLVDDHWSTVIPPHMRFVCWSTAYPCFGHDKISGKEWWRQCVLRSFDLAGATMTEAQQDSVFQRIYSVFGSQAAYERFEDALPFLHWAHRNKITCGLLSNADDRYRKDIIEQAVLTVWRPVLTHWCYFYTPSGDSILPMLELTHDEIHFQCFSKELGVEKPDSRFFLAALKEAEASLSMFFSSDDETCTMLRDDPLLPSQVLHIGNDFAKDFEGARRAGMHAILLDRYNETELAAEWRRRGAVVVKDLLDVVEFLGRCNCALGPNTAGDNFLR
jgi:putative hydrolase of the HAD superfamily